jgi:hypothetical protein
MQRLAPPTIADLRAERVQGARVWCLNPACQHSGVVTFESIGAPSRFTFIDLPKARRFVCRECGARDIQVMPDWPPYRPQRDVNLTRCIPCGGAVDVTPRRSTFSA